MLQPGCPSVNTISSTKPIESNSPLSIRFVCLVQRYIDFLVVRIAPISFGISPLKGFGLLVVATNVADEFAIEIFNRDEDAASDDITLNFGKPDLNLVKPGGVGRCVMDANMTISLEEFPDLGGAMSSRDYRR
jgi:hypothetical protein